MRVAQVRDVVDTIFVAEIIASVVLRNCRKSPFWSVLAGAARQDSQLVWLLVCFEWIASETRPDFVGNACGHQTRDVVWHPRDWLNDGISAIVLCSVAEHDFLAGATQYECGFWF